MKKYFQTHSTYPQYMGDPILARLMRPSEQYQMMPSEQYQMMPYEQQHTEDIEGTSQEGGRPPWAAIIPGMHDSDRYDFVYEEEKRLTGKTIGSEIFKRDSDLYSMYTDIYNNIKSQIPEYTPDMFDDDLANLPNDDTRKKIMRYIKRNKHASPIRVLTKMMEDEFNKDPNKLSAEAYRAIIQKRT